MRAAVVQFAPIFADAPANGERIAQMAQELGEQGVDLAVFPEAAVTGYVFSSKEEVMAAAVAMKDEPMRRIEAAAIDSGVHVVVGFAELAGGSLYNSAAFFGPKGTVGVYRKTHIPCLGLDRFVSAGDELTVFDTAIGKIGILICFDIRFPETARVMTLNGVEAICVPTNWPETADGASDYVCPARAIENNVFILASNRAGEENGYRFIGKSKIIAPGGAVLADIQHNREETAIREIDLSLARVKKIVRVPGEYEMEIIGARRPELYTSLSSEASLSGPSRKS